MEPTETVFAIVVTKSVTKIEGNNAFFKRHTREHPVSLYEWNKYLFFK